MSFKIQSNDPDHELVTKGKDSQRKQDSDDFNLIFLFHALRRKSAKCTDQKSWCTCRAIANEPFVFGRAFVAC